MKEFGIKSIRIYGFHLLFWAGVWFFFNYFFSYNSDDTRYIRWFSSILLPLTIAITYFAVYFLIPRFLLTRKYVRFFLFSFYTLVFSSYMIVLIIYGCLILILKYNATNIPPMSKNFFSVLVLVYLVTGIASFASILNHHFGTEKKNKELQNKILETQLKIREQELSYLKMQIHPHFLFNTLNTIYGLSLKQSMQTPDMILKLSNLLDYILYQVKKPRVSLKEELEHICEYIELEKIRFRDSLKVELNFPEIADGIEIAPMLLIPFVENAFKHGRKKNNVLEIAMQADMENDRLEFNISNSITGKGEMNPGHGIGLDNLRKRLELHYTGDHSLEITRNAGMFKVQLVIYHLNTIQNG